MTTDDRGTEDCSVADELEQALADEQGRCFPYHLKTLIAKAATTIRRLFDKCVELGVKAAPAELGEVHPTEQLALVVAPPTQEVIETQCRQGQRWCHACHKIECIDNTHPRFPPVRTRLPDERQSITRRWELKKPPHLNICEKCGYRWEEEAVIKVYCTVGLKPDGTPGELFIHADKAGSTARGALDHLAMAISVGLQHGIPLSVYIAKMIGSRYGAGGFTGDKQYPRVGSIGDLVGQWTRDKFFPKPKEEK